jgi:hypothetical protein
MDNGMEDHKPNENAKSTFPSQRVFNDGVKIKNREEELGKTDKPRRTTRRLDVPSLMNPQGTLILAKSTPPLRNDLHQHPQQTACETCLVYLRDLLVFFHMLKKADGYSSTPWNQRVSLARESQSQ